MWTKLNWTLFIILILLGIYAYHSTKPKEEAKSSPLVEAIAKTMEQEKAGELKDTSELPEAPKVSEQPSKQQQPATEAVVVPAKDMADFENFQQRFFQDIPKVEDIKKLTEEQVHLNPPVVTDSAALLGEAREFFVAHPYMKKQELSFYMSCADNKELLTSARALCAARADSAYLKLTGENLNPGVFAPEVAELKKRIGTL